MSDTGDARARRARTASQLASAHGGVVHRAELRQAGVTKADVRTEVRAGRWTLAGRHTVVIDGSWPSGEGMWWWAVWESGSGAILDGVSALQPIGLVGFSAGRIDVTIPRANRSRAQPGVRIHQRRFLGPVAGAGVPRARPEPATIRAAQWAVSDRQAALLVCLPVQQRLVHPARLLSHWESVERSPRRAVLDQVVRDVCNGAHSLGELKFGRLCRQYGLPEPSRQTIHRLPSGRVYLDAEWEDVGMVVEIDGGHHALALNPLDDALRENELVLTQRMVLRIPVLAFRIEERAFMQQIVRAYAARSALRGRRPVMQKASDVTPSA